MPEPQTKYQTGDISECWASESVLAMKTRAFLETNGVNTGHLLTVWSTCSPSATGIPHCESWEVRRVTSVSIFHPGSWASSHAWESSHSLLQRELSVEGVMDAGSGEGGRSLQQQCAWGWRVSKASGGGPHGNTLSVWFRLPLEVPLHFLSAVLHPSTSSSAELLLSFKAITSCRSQPQVVTH